MPGAGKFKAVPDDQGRYPQCFRPGSSAQLAVGAASASVKIPGVSTGDATGALVRIAADADMWIKFGDSAVTAAAGDLMFLTGTEHFVVPDGATHVAALTKDGSAAKVLGITFMG